MVHEYVLAMEMKLATQGTEVRAMDLNATHVGARFAFDDVDNHRHVYGIIDAVDIDVEAVWIFAKGHLAGDNHIAGTPLHLEAHDTIHVILDDAPVGRGAATTA